MNMTQDERKLNLYVNQKEFDHVSWMKDFNKISSNFNRYRHTIEISDPDCCLMSLKREWKDICYHGDVTYITFPKMDRDMYSFKLTCDFELQYFRNKEYVFHRPFDYRRDAFYEILDYLSLPCARTLIQSRVIEDMRLS